jgi:hypothetical protein
MPKPCMANSLQGLPQCTQRYEGGFTGRSSAFCDVLATLGDERLDRSAIFSKKRVHASVRP